jgi:hypothetical protein
MRGFCTADRHRRCERRAVCVQTLSQPRAHTATSLARRSESLGHFMRQPRAGWDLPQISFPAICAASTPHRPAHSPTHLLPSQPHAPAHPTYLCQSVTAEDTWADVNTPLHVFRTPFLWLLLVWAYIAAVRMYLASLYGGVRG